MKLGKGYVRFSEVVDPHAVSPFSVFVEDVVMIRYAPASVEYSGDSCLLVLRDREVVVNILMSEAEQRLVRARLEWGRCVFVDQAKRIEESGGAP